MGDGAGAGFGGVVPAIATAGAAGLGVVVADAAAEVTEGAELEGRVRVDESAAEREATEDTSDEVTVVVTEAGEAEEKLGRV